jgi:hypothetical protein
LECLADRYRDNLDFFVSKHLVAAMGDAFHQSEQAIKQIALETGGAGKMPRNVLVRCVLAWTDGFQKT